MIQITGTTEFDETKLLSMQSSEFKEWYNKNVNILINDKLIPDSLDIFNRPISYTVIFDKFTITIYPQYIYSDQSSWACSDLQIKIKIN